MTRNVFQCALFAFMKKVFTITILLLNFLSLTLFGVSEVAEQDAQALVSAVEMVETEISRFGQPADLPLLADHVLDIDWLLHQKEIEKHIKELQIQLRVLIFDLQDQCLLYEVGALEISEATDQKIKEKLSFIESTLQPHLDKISKASWEQPEKARNFIENHYLKDAIEERAATFSVKSKESIYSLDNPLTVSLLDYRICDCGGFGDCGYFSLVPQLTPEKINTENYKTLYTSLYFAMQELRIDVHNALVSLYSSAIIHPNFISNLWIDFSRLLKLIKTGHFSKTCSLLSSDNTLALRPEIKHQIEALKKAVGGVISSQAEASVIAQYCADIDDIMLIAYLYKKPLVVVGTFPNENEYYQFWDFSNPFNIVCGADYQANKEEHFDKFNETLNKIDCIRMFYTDFHWQAILPKSNPLCSKLTATRPEHRVFLATKLSTETFYSDLQAASYSGSNL